MTPEVEKHLDRLGWQTVKKWYPVEAGRIEFVMSPTGGQLTENKQKARSDAQEIRELTKRILTVANDLSELNDHQRVVLNLGSAESSEEMDQARDFVGEAKSALLRLEGGLYDLVSRLEFDGGVPKPGWPKNIAARLVCKAVAITYFLSRHQLPSIGKLENGGGMSGEYGRTCEAIIAELGIGHKDVFGACKDALDNLRNLGEDHLEEVRLQAIRPKGRIGGISLFSSLWTAGNEFE